MGQSYTIHCAPSPIVFSAINLTTRSKPSHCARCSDSKCFLTETDGWDHYALSLNTARQVAILLLNKWDRELDNMLQRPVKPRNADAAAHMAPRYTKKLYANTTNAELAELAISTLPKELTHGVCMINANCRECGSSFQFTVSNEPRTRNMPLTYCPYCATPTLVISPISTDSYIERSINDWRFLADKYDAPKVDESPEATLVRIADIRAKYTFWEQQTTFKTFDEFMANYSTMVINELRTPLVNRVTLRSKVQQKPKHRKIRLVVKRLPVPAHTYIPEPIETTVALYATCGICGCEKPHMRFGFCEPCTLVLESERSNILKHYPLS